MRRFLLALQYFTRMPLPAPVAAWVGFSPAMMRAALAHLPGVGWVVGGVSLLVLVLALWMLGGQAGAHDGASVLVAATLAIGASIWFTGAFHEDGLADVGDALGGFVSADRALQIMKDSRLGSYGVITLVMALLLRVGLLAALVRVDVALAANALLAGHVLSRWAPLFLAQWLPYVGGRAAADDGEGRRGTVGKPDGGVNLGNDPDGIRGSGAVGSLDGAEKSALVEGRGGGRDSDDAGPSRSDEATLSKARPLVEGRQPRILLIGSLWATPAIMLVGLCLGGWAMAGVLLMGALLVWQLGLFFRRRLGGVTGDCLGATQQVAEIACHLVMLIALRWV